MTDSKESGTILAEGISKSFGHIKALKNVSFKIHPGEFWVFFGPNGAGKTTLTGVLATLLKPTSGKLVIDGIAAADWETSHRRRIGFISHQTFLYGDLTASENLLFYGRLYELADLAKTVSRILDEVGLGAWAHHRVRGFSRGMQQRLAIARVLLHNPSILLLDEPYSGLDQHAMRQLQTLLTELHSKDRTIVLTTHNLKLGLSLCTHAAIIARGRIVYNALQKQVKSVNFDQIYYDIVERL